MNLQEYLEENYPGYNIATPDGFDEAFLGVARQAGGVIVAAIYDRDACIEILAREMGFEGAEEHFAFNTEDAYVGTGTPMFLQRPEGGTDKQSLTVRTTEQSSADQEQALRSDLAEAKKRIEMMTYALERIRDIDWLQYSNRIDAIQQLAKGALQ